MKKRILKISHPTFVNNNLYQLKTLLLQNSYPKGLVNKILYSTSDFSPHGGTPQIPTNNSVVNDSTLRDDVDGDVTQWQNHKAEVAINTSEVCRFGSLPNITGLTIKLIRTFRNENIELTVRNIKKVQVCLLN